MTDTATALEVLSGRDVHFLGVLERLTTDGEQKVRPSGTLFDLERIADVIDSDQPDIVFQPIVELNGESVVGYEALSRFRIEPAMSPDWWFAQAVRVGLGVELELKALSSALEFLHDVPRAAFVSLNVSATTVCSRGLRALLEDVPGERLVLELTEHDVVHDYHCLNHCLRWFRERGFRVAVDDAGSGCAGFSHIVKVAPDVIKLDRALTQSIDLTPARQELAASVVALARGIGAIVLAEGIESTCERDALARIGVTEGQGYLFGRPGERPWRG
jgi:EAL domain-containing protein (putative c-di-GMP-specific phosphodiesterase class I)